MFGKSFVIIPNYPKSAREVVTLVVADLHGSTHLRQYLIKKVADTREQHPNAKIIVILNGDIAGSRGPMMNQIVGAFYEVFNNPDEPEAQEEGREKLFALIERVLGRDLRNDEKENISNKTNQKQTEHSGTFLTWLRQQYQDINAVFEQEEKALIGYLEELSKKLHEVARENIEIYLLPGNCEVSTVRDFKVYPNGKGLKQEIIRPLKKRYYWRSRSQLKQAGITFVDQPTLLQLGDKKLALLVPSNCLEKSSAKERRYLRWASQIADCIICHYPYATAQEAQQFNLGFKIMVNKKDERLMEEFRHLVESLKEDARIVFGHIHEPVTEETEPQGYVELITAQGHRRIYTSPGAPYVL